MKKIHLLVALSTLLVISIVIILIICWRHSPETLKVVLYGPTVIVRTKDKPDVLTVFSPRDPENLHAFFPNRLKEGITQTKDGISQAVHITLSPYGLERRSDFDLPVDPYYPSELVVNTETWQRPKAGDPTKDYFVTIELPLPERITFVPPLQPVTFADGTKSFMATNFVLEYKVTEFGKIRVTSPELSNLSPLSSSTLQKQYADFCGKSNVRGRYYQSCIEIRNLLQQCEGGKSAVFFFGVGIPPLDDQNNLPDPTKLAEHAVKFFDVMLQSFPKWTGPRLAPKGAFAPQGSDGSRLMLMETSFRPAAPRPRLRLVTAVIDCKAGNVIVNAQKTQ